MEYYRFCGTEFEETPERLRVSEASRRRAYIVSLQRDLHDWRAVFAFTHGQNGNFAFNFFIALKPQPELKFDYARSSIRRRSHLRPAATDRSSRTCRLRRAPTSSSCAPITWG